MPQSIETVSVDEKNTTIPQVPPPRKFYYGIICTFISLVIFNIGNASGDLYQGFLALILSLIIFTVGLIVEYNHLRRHKAHRLKIGEVPFKENIFTFIILIGFGLVIFCLLLITAIFTGNFDIIGH